MTDESSTGRRVNHRVTDATQTDDSRKRIVYVAPHSPGAVGYESQEDFLTMAHYHQKYCQLMVEEGHDVYFIHFGDEYRSFTHEYGHVVRQLPVTVGSGFNTELSVRLPVELFRLNPDVLHFHGFNPKLLFYVPVAWVLDAKLVLQNHGASLNASKVSVRLLYLLFRLALLPTDCTVLSVNRAERRNLERAKVTERVDYIPNAVDTEFYDREDSDVAKERIGLGTDRSYLLYVGRIDESKGVEYLVEAFDSLADEYPNLDLVLVYGAAEDAVLERIEQRCAEYELHDRVRFVGRVSESDLPHYYNVADVCAFPSVSEGFGVVTLEAMSCGVPVVGTTAHTEGEQRHLVDGENALIAEAGSVHSLYAQIDRFLSRPELASEVGENGYLYVRREQTWEAVKRKLRLTYL